MWWLITLNTHGLSSCVNIKCSDAIQRMHFGMKTVVIVVFIIITGILIMDLKRFAGFWNLLKLNEKDFSRSISNDD